MSYTNIVKNIQIDNKNKTRLDNFHSMALNRFKKIAKELKILNLEFENLTHRNFELNFTNNLEKKTLLTYKNRRKYKNKTW